MPFVNSLASVFAVDIIKTANKIVGKYTKFFMEKIHKNERNVRNLKKKTKYSVHNLNIQLKKEIVKQNYF